MAKVKFKNQWNKTFVPTKAKKSILPRVTTPNLAMSIRTILNKHGLGGVFPQGKEPIYEGNVIVPRIETMDLADVKILQEQIEERIALQRKAELDAKDAAKRKADKEAYDKHVEEAAKKLAEKKRFKDRDPEGTGE